MADYATPDPRRKGTWQDLATEEVEKAKARRARVLAHADLAERLRERPYRIADPSMWTGFVPPALRGSDRPNNSPIRRQLIEILRAVAEREGGEQ